MGTLVFSVTIASTFFSISDLVYTLFDINRKESNEIFMLFFLTKYAERFYINNIEVKYGEEVRKKFSVLEEILSEEEIEKIISGNLTQNEKEACFNKVNNIELKKFLTVLIQSQEEEDIVIEEDDDKRVVEMFNFVKFKEKIYFSLPAILAVIGLVSLLIILTLRFEPPPLINNVCTLIAFLSVIFSLMLRECYKAKSLEQLANERREIIKDMKASNKN